MDLADLSRLGLFVAVLACSCDHSQAPSDADAGPMPDGPPGQTCQHSGLLVTRGINYEHSWYDTRPSLVTDHNGGVLVVYNLVTYESADVFKDWCSAVQRFGPDGKPGFGQTARCMNRPGPRAYLMDISPNPEDRWMVTWYEAEEVDGGYKGQTYGQVIDLQGKDEWSKPVELGDQDCLSRIPDGSGGFVVMCGALTMQRVDKDGNPLWPKAVSLSGGVPSLAVDHGDGKGGVVYDNVVAVPVSTDHFNSMVTLQHIDGNGKPVYSDEGWPITGKDRKYNLGGVVQVGGGDLGLIVEEGPDANVSNPPAYTEPITLYATRVDLDGKITWPAGKPIPLTDTTTYKWVEFLIGDGEGGLLVAWVEDRDADGKDECYGQRVRGSGLLVWPVNGRNLTGAAGVLCKAPGAGLGDAHQGGVLRFGNEGFAVVHELREDVYGTWHVRPKQHGLAVQRFDWNLIAQWSQPAMLTRCDQPFEVSDNNAISNGIVTDGAGGMWVQWEVGPWEWLRNDDHILQGVSLRLQRIGGDGKLVFPGVVE